MVEAVLRGAALGFVTCLSIGPVTVAVMKAALERRVLAALLCGLGAALVDGLEAYLAYLGVAELLHALPGTVVVLYLAAGGVLLIAGIRALRRGPRPDAHEDIRVASGFGALVQGVVLTALNPAPLLGWVALAGSLFSDLGRVQALVASGGVTSGVLLWFVFVTWLTVRGRSALGARAHVVTRALDFVLAGAGVYLLVRGAMHALDG